MKVQHRLIRWFKFEFWPYWFFYLPFTPLWLLYSIRSWNPIYFTRVNYKTSFGGFFQYSKYSLIKGINQRYLPKTKLYQSKEALLQDQSNEVFEKKFVYKPDIGERGRAVSVYPFKDALFKDINELEFPCLIQSFILLPIELGVLFYRFPNGKKGITSIVGKSFLEVHGDGKLTLEQLIENELRASDRREVFQKRFQERWNEVIPTNESILLEEVGNHCKGTTFYDYRKYINDDLVEVVDEITKDIPGFHFGRLDLKCASIEDLYQGKKIEIIEVNGVNSEAAHIYDPKMSLWEAYKSVYENLNIAFKISMELQKMGIKTPNTFGEFLSALIRHYSK